ncbi:MAG: LysM peptidoglycan-binding domain-containing protein [Deltaproteobacteria bacterium]|nr:LysM peptidoglycan-binding domain-containing protein [Deltaproteobacteria bacterium]
MKSRAFNRLSPVFCILLLVFFFFKPIEAKEEEKTYSISLVKTADMGKEVVEVDNRKVLTQTLTIKKGDWIWKIMREKGLLEKRNLSELIAVLKKLNKSLTNLDLIHPGEKIIIPLKIAPLSSGIAAPEGPVKKVIPIADLKDIDFNKYTVKQGDALVRVARGQYDIPDGHLYGEYLELVRNLNPHIKDLDTIYPGQVVRLPIYSPEVVKKPVKAALYKKRRARAGDRRRGKKGPSATHDLGKIFQEMGEQWVETGKYSILLKSGSQVQLNAESCPFITLQNGQKVIVDLKNKLPEETAGRIGSLSENYRLVRLTQGDDLRASLDKVLKACNYPELYKKGEPYELKGDITIRVTGDWVVKPGKGRSDQSTRAVVLNLKHVGAPSVPPVIQDFLKGRGITIIDYPPPALRVLKNTLKIQTLPRNGNPQSLVKTVLTLTGQTFSYQAAIPVYEGQKGGAQSVMKADFLLSVNGRDTIIDLSGLSRKSVSFFLEHQFQILSLAAENDPLVMVSKVLDFLGTKFDPSPRSFWAIPGDDSRNVGLTLPGVIFSDTQGKAILATPLALPEQIKVFLSKKGYHILPLSFS